MYVCNVDEKSATTGNRYVDAVKTAVAVSYTHLTLPTSDLV